MSASPAPVDQISKRILRCLSSNVALDVGAIARAVGASEEVVRHRLAALQDGGVLRGIGVRIDSSLLGNSYEFLVSGAAGEATDKQAIGRLCSTTDVTRVFGLAAARSFAFTVVGHDPAATQARALALAQQAGLVQPQAVLIVKTFQDRAGSALPDALGLPDALAAEPVAA
jgi:DNA-binding Lrp family transcriptional regulator